MNTVGRQAMWVAIMLLVSGARAAPLEALRWKGYREPVFPPELASTIVNQGYAVLAFTFNDEGEIADRLVLAASHPAFSRAVLEASAEWQVDTVGLARFVRRETLRFNFERTRFVVGLSQREALQARFSEYGDEAATAMRTVREEEIDRPLKVATSVTAEYPAELKARGVSGEATINFVIDALGRVRVPAISEATRTEFGEAALAAVKRWTFEPARYRGAPVQVMAERTLAFGAVAKK